ncbi:hypothetical protein IDH44_20770 [Paenibacillus sp. IB182496]|uniref:Uncharacterized protein n=1 Tax=Paenibacillus sabuli TaxID=2772509 RepID=A0A927BVJ7_9BACL|nr:hypothetical protein [Paenibacillus sabuli]MBD2847631.1 hypothetical protein [Paenibacillus sabuli]
MSMPNIPEELHRPSRHEVAIDLLKSIAMEETALSHLMNAEAEKIQAFVGERLQFPSHPSTVEMMKIGNQTFKLLDVIVMKEWLLLRKLEAALELCEPHGHEHHCEEEE